MEILAAVVLAFALARIAVGILSGILFPIYDTLIALLCLLVLGIIGG